MLKDFIKSREERKSKKLAALGFILGAAAAVEGNKDADAGDALVGGIAGIFIAGLCEVLAPKTTNILKEIL